MLHLPRISILSMLAGASLMASAGADLGGRWTWKNPQTPLAAWRDIIFANGRFVAITMGHGGHLLYTSEDGLSWTERALPAEQTLFKVDFVNGRFIALGQDGILTSTNALNWTIDRTPRDMCGVTYGNGTYVAVGSARAIATSLDGEKWTLNLLPPQEDGSYWRSVRGVTFGNGKFVAVGGFGCLLTSQDGKQWARHNWPQGLAIAEYSPVRVTFSDGKFFYANGSSTNGVDWNVSETDSLTRRSVRGADGKLAALNYDTVFVSEDGKSWEPAFRAAIGEYPGGIAYGNGRYVMVGDRVMAHSVDGDNWERLPPSWAAAQKLVFGDGQFLRYGGTNLSSSIDGAEWEYRAAPESLNEIVHGNGLFVGLAETGTIYSSVNGRDWNHQIDTMQFAGLHFLRDLFFIRQTNGTVRVSRDAREWSEVEIMSGERVRTLAYGNDRFLALGQSNVYSSFDGYAWEKIAAAPLYGFRMAFGNGRFLLAGQAGMGPATLYTSEDGREWRIGSGGATHMFYGFGFAAGHFYMLDTWGAIHFSTDGMNWSFNRLSNYPLLGFAEGNGVMLIAGGSDVVLQKPRESAATKWLPLKLSGPNVELHFSKESRPVQIEASSDLATWSSIATYNDAPQNALIFRPQPRDAMNFYRARELDFR